MIVSDNGRNFIAAERDLAVKCLDDAKIISATAIK